MSKYFLWVDLFLFQFLVLICKNHSQMEDSVMYLVSNIFRLYSNNVSHLKIHAS